MSFTPFHPQSSLNDALQDRPDLAAPMFELSEAIMRADGPLNPAQRELVFAYVSGLNDCGFCRASHTAGLIHFGVARDTVDRLIDNDEFEGIEPAMRPVLRYARKVVETPQELATNDAKAVYEVGWHTTALAQVVWVCALAQSYNTLVAGLGIGTDPKVAEFNGEQMHKHGYAYFKELLGPQTTG